MYGLDPVNFDIIDPRATAQGGMPGQGLFQGLASAQGQSPQPGAPISGSVAGLLGLPTVAGPDGTTRLVQGQAAPGQPQSYGGSGLMVGLLGLPQYGGQAQGVSPGQLQPNIGSAIGSGLRSLFNGIMGAGR